MRAVARHLLNSRAFEKFYDWVFPPPKCLRVGCVGPCDNVFHNTKTELARR